jgi:hypothetical protein
VADSNSEKVSYVNFDGRTIVDVNALLRDPKVQATIERLSKENERFRGKPGVTFIKPLRQRD